MIGRRAAELLERLRHDEAGWREPLLRTLAEVEPRLRSTFERLLAADAATATLDPGDPRLGGPMGLEVLARVDALPALLGDTIGSVQLVEILGEGGMGTVFRGHDVKLERSVAVKTLRADRRAGEEARARFRREARILSRLDHPGICRVFDLVERPEADYLILEYVEGETLRQHAAGEADGPRRLALAQAIADALAAAHDRGIVHRDLKPDNVMVRADGAVKILDFGIARAREVGTADGPNRSSGSGDVGPVDRAAGQVPADAGADATTEPLTRFGSLVGTVAYMSPEQARSEEVSEPSDIYSFGLILQELFTGRPAFPPLPLEELLERVRASRPEPLDDLEEPLAGLVASMLSPRPGDRPTAAEIAARLRRIAERPATRRRRRMAAALAGLAVSAIGVAAWLAHRAALGGPLLDPGQPARIALLPVDNRAGEAGLDWVELGLTELMQRSLAALPGAEVLPLEETARWLAPRGDRRGEAGDHDLRTLARARGVGLVVRPRLSRDGGELTLSYRTVNAAGAASERVLRGRDAVGLASLAARHLAVRLAPGAALPELDRGLVEDPVVARMYATGVQRLEREGPALARPFFQVCLDLDPQFVWGRLRLARVELLAGGDEALDRILAGLGDLLPAQGIERDLIEGQLATRRGRTQEGSAAFARARDLARRAGLRQAEGRVLRDWAEAAFRSGGADAGAPLVAEARAIFEEVGDESALVELEVVEALAHVHRVRPALALPRLEAILRRAEELGDPWLAMRTRNLLATNLMHLMRHGEAEAALRDTIGYFERVGDRGEAMLARNTLGVVLLRTQRVNEAAEAFRAVREFALATGRVEHFVRATINEASVHLGLHRPVEARRLLEEVARRDHWMRNSPVFETNWIRLEYEEGRYARAWSLFEKLLAERPDLAPLVEGYIAPIRTAARTGVRQPLPGDL